VGRAATILYKILSVERRGTEGKEPYSRVGDLSLLDGDVEVDADENALSRKIEVGDCEFV